MEELETSTKDGEGGKKTEFVKPEVGHTEGRKKRTGQGIRGGRSNPNNPTDKKSGLWERDKLLIFEQRQIKFKFASQTNMDFPNQGLLTGTSIACILATIVGGNWKKADGN